MGKNTLIVLGFLLLCIFLSLKKEEGFATINASEFENACNADGSTCMINRSGSMGFNCSVPTADFPYYIISGSNKHSQSFDIQATGCSARAYQVDPSISPSASPCINSGGEYNLSGCEPKCIRPPNLEGYNLLNPPEFLEPHSGATFLSNNMGLTNSSDDSTCAEGYYPAKNICFSRNTGEIINYPSVHDCVNHGGVWYNNEGFPVGWSQDSRGSGEGTALEGNKIKLYCNQGGDPYSVMGCEQGCLSRNRNYDEYNTTDPTNENKELIQILDRVDPDNNDNTILKYLVSGDTPYNMSESSPDGSGLLNPSAFNVTETTSSNANFKEDINNQDETSINIEFGGSIGVNPCPVNDETNRKYNVRGLFPLCDDEHECLNFHITYDSDAPMNINDFKETMIDNAEDILGTDTVEDITKYQNSLYYYRRYRDNNDNINIEGQIKCNDNPDSPFNCEIVGSVFDPNNPYYLASDEQVRQNCNDVCSSHGLVCDSDFTYNDFGEDLTISQRKYAIQDLIRNSNGWKDSYQWYQAGLAGPGDYGTADLSYTFSDRGTYADETNVPLFITYYTNDPNTSLRFGITRGFFESDVDDEDRPQLGDSIGDVCNYVIPPKHPSWIGDRSRQVCKCKQA